MSASIDTILEIDTPEHLAFRTRIAGPGRRMLAWLIDIILGALIVFLAVFLFGAVAATGAEGLGTGLTLIALFAFNWFYFTIWELTTGGRSAGKIALKLRVVRTNGLPTTWVQSVARNFLRTADLMFAPPYLLLLGPAIMAMNHRFRRLGDMLAGTIVVVEEPAQVNRETAVPADPAIVAELPAGLPLDRDDLEALELFVNREHVSEARREELAEIVAQHYAELLHVDPPRRPVAFLGSLWARSQDPTRRTRR